MNQQQSEYDCDITLSDTYEGIDLDNNIWIDESPDGASKIIVGKDFQNGLKSIHEFVDQVRVIDMPAFLFVERKGRKHAVHTKLNSIPTSVFISPEFRQQYELSEQVRVFLEAEDELGLGGEWPLHEPQRECQLRSGMLIGELANGFVQLIRLKTRCKNFRRRLAKRRFATEENFRRGKMLIDALFNRYSRLNIIRVDLNYLQAHKADIEQAKMDLARLLNNSRNNSIFHSVVGHIWRLEWAPMTGYHWHVIFFLDGSKTRHDTFVTGQIGKYWETFITGNRGRHHNCNADKNKYKRLGIGMTSHADEQKRNVLLHRVLRYLAKVDEYARPHSSKGARTFGTSQMPEAHPGTGRKRRIERSALEIPPPILGMN